MMLDANVIAGSVYWGSSKEGNFNCIHTQTLLSREDSQRIVQEFVEEYKTQRLDCVLGEIAVRYSRR